MRRRPRIELDLVAPRRRLRWPGYALLLTSAALSFLLLERYRESALALERLTTSAELVAEPRHRPPPPTLPFDEKSARQALRQLAVPWAPVFQALEHTATPEVAVLQVEPQAQQGVLKITAEARHPAAMFRYLRALEREPNLTRVHLASHEVLLDRPHKPMRFSAEASFGRAR